MFNYKNISKSKQLVLFYIKKHNLPISVAVNSHWSRVYCVAAVGTCSFQRRAVFYWPRLSSVLIRKLSDAFKRDEDLT